MAKFIGAHDMPQDKCTKCTFSVDKIISMETERNI